MTSDIPLAPPPSPPATEVMPFVPYQPVPLSRAEGALPRGFRTSKAPAPRPPSSRTRRSHSAPQEWRRLREEEVEEVELQVMASVLNPSLRGGYNDLIRAVYHRISHPLSPLSSTDE